MNTTKLIGFALAAMVSTTAMAEFTFNAGYSWRSQAKTKFSGTSSHLKTEGEGGAYSNGHVNIGEETETGLPDWEGNRFGSLPSNSVVDEFDYTLILSGEDSVADGSDEDSAQGLTTSIGFDFYDDETISIGANLRFAAYWGLKNSTSGGYARYEDTYRFPSFLVGIDSQDDLHFAEPEFESRDYLAGGPGGRVTLKSDLYQIGLGPKATWHALSFLDVYGGVEALCCFVSSDLDAGGASTSEVNNLWGVGGHIGFTGYITENLGIFGQVGYEWIDEDDVSVKGIHAKTDYSSLVISAGLQYRF